MNRFSYQQMSFSTADDERSYFTGATLVRRGISDKGQAISSGVYRVIDGSLYLMVDEPLPPILVPTSGHQPD